MAFGALLANGHAALVGILTQAFWTVNDFRLVQRRKSSQEIPMIMRTKKTPRIIDVWTQCLFLDHSKYLPWLKWSFWEPAKAQIWQISSPQAGVVSVLRSSGGSNVSLHWCYLLYTMLQTIWPTVFSVFIWHFGCKGMSGYHCCRGLLFFPDMLATQNHTPGFCKIARTESGRFCFSMWGLLGAVTVFFF